MYRLLLIAFIALPALLHAQCTVVQQAAQVTLGNGLAEVGFNTSNADLNRLVYQGRSLLNGKDQRGYLLGPGFSMYPATYRLVRQSADLIEIAFLHRASNHFSYDLHYVIIKDVPGVYCFLVQSHDAADSAGNFGQTRWGLRADEALFDYHLVRDTLQGPMPKMAELKAENEIQDWTYKMADGTVYTKYNYADYIEGRHVHGMAGRQSGLGMFVIQASHEYLNGGPTKQYQNVHSNPYLICMFNCGHFLSDIRKGDNIISGNWSKVQGPFLLYLNQGSSTDAMWQDAKTRAAAEIAQWPYRWMQHPGYPLQRATVSGTLLHNGKPVAVGTHVLLAAPGYDWQAQSQGYIYSTTTTAGGKFALPGVRTGSYTLYAWGNNLPGQYEQAAINIKNASNVNMGTLRWQTPATKTIFQLGVADRTTRGFKHSNHVRAYGLFDSVPANLEYTIGTSREAEHWYYAQTKRGTWQVHFAMGKPGADSLLLTLAIAGAAKNPTLEVLVNDSAVWRTRLGNDASVYRSAVAGGYYQMHTVRVPATLLRPGSNTLSLRLPDVKPGGGVMYDAIKLEER
jgi:rhamnogalacturonan endolyase